MRSQEAFSLKTNLRILMVGIMRIFFWWCLAELMIHLMYIHALYNSAPPLEAASYWALGEYRNNSRYLLSPPTSRTPVYFSCVPLLVLRNSALWPVTVRQAVCGLHVTCRSSKKLTVKLTELLPKLKTILYFF